MATDLTRLQTTWDSLGRTDPMWAILADPRKKGNRWDEAEFFASGRDGIARLLRDGRDLGYPLNHGRALDFGCGIGRLTQALAEHFVEANGVDIAPSMIDQAREHNKHGNRCHYHVNDRGDLSLFPDKHFDCIVSAIVLQHIPPVYARQYIFEFLRVLATGGLLVFQVPDRRLATTPSRPANAATLLDRLHPRIPEFILGRYRKLRRRAPPCCHGK